MKSYLERGPRIIERGEGLYVYDRNGKQYLDAASSLWNVLLGHGVKEVMEAIVRQVETLEYSTLFRASNSPALKLAEKITNRVADPLNYIFFTSNGSESVETAIKMSRQYFNQDKITTKHKIISLKRAFSLFSFFPVICP